MAEEDDDDWWGISDADDWRNATDALKLWCLARDQTRFNRRLVNPSRVKKYNRRLQYLLGVAICRRVEHLFPDPRCQRALQVAEAFAEGTATPRKLEAAHDAVDAVDDSHLPVAVAAAVRAVCWLGPDDYEVTEAVELVIDVVGYQAAVAAGVLAADGGWNAGRAVWRHPAFIAGKEEEEKGLSDLIRDILGNPFQPVEFDAAWLKWNDGLVVRMATAIYNERTFDRLPILADALEDAGCTDKAILSHCRGPGPHVRGCWVVDGGMGKK